MIVTRDRDEEFIEVLVYEVAERLIANYIVLLRLLVFLNISMTMGQSRQSVSKWANLLNSRRHHNIQRQLHALLERYIGVWFYH